MKLIAIVLMIIAIGGAVLPVRIKWYWKILLSLLVGVSAFKFFIFQKIGGGTIFDPGIPVIIGYIGTWIYCFLFIFCLLVAVAGVLWIGYFSFCLLKRRKISTLCREHYDRSILCLLGAAVVLTFVGLVQGAVLPGVTEKEIVIDGLHEKADGLRLLLITDLHIEKSTSEKYIKDLIELANKQNPDVICLVGDLMDGRVRDIGEKVKMLKEFRAKHGVLGVPGNHEYFSGYEEWMTFLEKETDILMLPNASTTIRGITFAGITDKQAQYHGKKPMPDIKKALRRADSDLPVILLSHRPEHVYAAAEAGVDLQLSGHTHGGIIWGVDRLVGFANAGFYSGEYYINGTRLYVSNGTGIWRGLPIRLGHNSEITVFTLKPR